MIAPPYTSDFVQLFLPILENDSIAGTIRTEGEHDPVAEFIGERLSPTHLFFSHNNLLKVEPSLTFTSLFFSSLQVKLHHDQLMLKRR